MASRIRSRLDRMEQATQATVSEPALRLLVQLLARLDALWWPQREHGDHRAEIRRLQRGYLAGTIGLRAASQGEQNWKAGHSRRGELIACGLVEPLIEGGQVVSVRLTEQGVADAMALVGDRLRSLNETPVRAVAVLVRRASGSWLAEAELFGEAVQGTDPNSWSDATELALPLLRCGLIESNSDLWNRVSYRATEVTKIPHQPASDREPLPWADECYIEAFNAELAALKRLECVDGGIFIPLPCT